MGDEPQSWKGCDPASSDQGLGRDFPTGPFAKQAAAGFPVSPSGRRRSRKKSPPAPQSGGEESPELFIKPFPTKPRPKGGESEGGPAAAGHPGPSWAALVPAARRSLLPL